MPPPKIKRGFFSSRPPFQNLYHLAKANPFYLRQLILLLAFCGLALASTFPAYNDYADAASLGLQLSLYCLLFTGILLWPVSARPLSYIGHTLHRTILKPPAIFFLLTCFVYFFLLTLYLSGALFGHIPHVNDTINQYIAAKIIAGGHLTGTAHPLQQFFSQGWIYNDRGKIYTPYSAAPLFLLALGHLVHMPWLIDPLTGALTLPVIYYLAREVTTEATARLAVLLACVSPFLIFMSSEYMNHALSLLCSTLFMLYFIRTLKEPKAASAMLSGASLGLLFLARPFTALGVSLPFILLGLWKIVKNPRAYFPAFFLALLIFTAALVLQGWYDLLITGDALITPYYKMFGDAGMPGFGDKWHGIHHDLAAAIMLAVRRISMISQMLFEWPVSSLLFILMLVVAGKARAYESLLLTAFISLLLTYCSFIGYHEIFGPRYVYESSSALIVVTAIAMARMPSILRGALHWHVRKTAVWGALAIFLSIVMTLSSQKEWPGLYYYYAGHYLEGDADYYHYIRDHVQPPALVFIPWSQYFYVDFENPPADNAPVVYALNWRWQNPQLLRYYPYRSVYSMKKGLLHPIASPYAQCIDFIDDCHSSFAMLQEGLGLNAMPNCPTRHDLTISHIMMPSNMLLQASFCSARSMQRLNRLDPPGNPWPVSAEVAGAAGILDY